MQSVLNFLELTQSILSAWHLCKEILCAESYFWKFFIIIINVLHRRP